MTFRSPLKTKRVQLLEYATSLFRTQSANFGTRMKPVVSGQRLGAQQS